MWKQFAFVLLLLTLVSASCPTDCRSSPEVPRCAAGVGLVPDGCGCCRVCARQLFEDCSRTQPCDHTKGLECNFGGGLGSAKGICRAKSDGRTCEYNNRIYQNGEIFRPNCKHQCTCMDGAVGCASLCPRELLLPKPGCFQPERVKARGQCCERLVCPQGAKATSPAAEKRGRGGGPEDELAPAWRGRGESLPVFRSHPAGQAAHGGVRCASQTSSWSPCSKSCGPGVSTRMTNNDRRCEAVAETRICEVRPCTQQTSSRDKKGKKCKRIRKASRPVHLWFSGCRSLKKFQPQYCGSCSDGRCCRPHHTQTVPVRFRCRNGEITERMVMVIQSCECDLHCSDRNERTPVPHGHFNEIHKVNM